MLLIIKGITPRVISTFLLFALFLLLPILLSAQLDSLLLAIKTNGSDSSNALAFDRGIQQIQYSKPAESLEYAYAYYDMVKDEKSYFLGTAHTIIGNCEFINEHYDKAIEHLIKAIKIYEAGGDVSNLALAYNSLASVYQVRKEVEPSIRYFKKSIASFEQLDNKPWVANISLNLGAHYMEFDSLDQAEIYLGEAIKYHEAPGGHPIYLGFGKLSLGSLRVKQKRFKEAIPALQEALERVPIEVNPLVHSAAYAGLGHSYLDTGNDQKAIVNLNEALRLSKQIKNVEQQEKVAQLIARYYKENDNFKKAFEYQSQSFELRDSFLNAERDQRLVSAMQEFEADKKTQQLELLTTQNDLKDLKISNGNRNLLLSLLAFLGLAVFAFYIFRNRNKVKKLNSELRNQKDVISDALKDKELLLKEIHHRVKNNLQVISSLLSLQSEFIKDDTALSAIQEGRDRVKSMAIIHQDLYQEDNITGIHVRPYFEKLSRSLFNSYNIRPELIKLNLNIEDINLDVDTVIPLGLVVNELITNALKYAFPDNRSGQINIDLKEMDGQLILKVVDNGVGFDATRIGKEQHSFGYQIIRAFKDKLDAELIVDGKEGTKVTFAMRDYQLAG